MSQHATYQDIKNNLSCYLVNCTTNLCFVETVILSSYIHMAKPVLRSPVSYQVHVWQNKDSYLFNARRRQAKTLILHQFIGLCAWYIHSDIFTLREILFLIWGSTCSVFIQWVNNLNLTMYHLILRQFDTINFVLSIYKVTIRDTILMWQDSVKVD